MSSEALSPDRDTPGLTGRVMILMLGVVVTTFLGAGGWGLSRMASFHEQVNARLAKMETTMAVMEGNRFTTDDGREVYARMADLASAVAGVRSMNERLGRIEARLDKLFEKLMASRGPATGL